MVLPVHAPPADQRHVGRQFFQQQSDLAEFELLIGRRKGDEVFGRRGEAGFQRAAIPAIGEMLDQAEIGNARGQLGARDLARAIAAAVVDEQNFIVRAQRLGHARNLFDSGDDVGFFIIGRDDNRQT